MPTLFNLNFLILLNCSRFQDRWQRSQGCVLTHSVAEGLSVETVRDNWSKVSEMEGGDFPTSNQEATMELVEKLKPAQASGSQAANSTSGLDHVIIYLILIPNP